MLPVQLGLAVPAGTEILFHKVSSQLRLSSPENQSLLLVDLKNAFNCVDRMVVQKAIEEQIPSLLRWHMWSYGLPSTLCFGKHEILSRQGVQQGDPLSSLLFALGIHSAIMQIHQFPGVLWSAWYADDGSIQAPLPILNQILPVLATSLSACNILVNPTKTRIVTSNVPFVDSFPELKCLHKISLDDGFELLGGFYPGRALGNFLELK